MCLWNPLDLENLLIYPSSDNFMALWPCFSQVGAISQVTISCADALLCLKFSVSGLAETLRDFFEVN